MDVSKSTEVNMIPETISKPRPPPPMKKPKPSIPKKPPVAAKPVIEQKPVILNGGPGHHRSPTEPITHVPETRLSPNNQPSLTSSQSMTKPRPKGPPPPLPKTPPSTPPNAVQKTPSINKTPPSTSPTTVQKAASINKTPPTLPKTPPSKSLKTVQKTPSINKTPPPLPRTPPRGSIKPATSNSSISSAQNSIEKATSDQDTAADNTHEPNVKTASEKSDDQTKLNCDSDDKTNGDYMNSNNKLESKSTFAEVKSKFYTKSTEEMSVTKSTPKFSLKPSFKQKEKKKDINDSVEKKDTDMSEGNSIWFVNTDSPETVKESDKTESNKVETADINNTSKEITIVSEKLDSSIKYRKVGSPGHSPKVPRKPPPKPPAKINNLSKSTENVSIVNSELTVKDNDIVDDGGTSNVCTKANSASDLSERKENVTEGQTIPKNPTPAPRKPTPVARPRPAPRKRLSSSTGTGNDSTSPSNSGSNIDLTQISDGTGKDVTADTVNEDSESKVNNSESADNTESEVVTRRIVTTESGKEEEYQVIDRSSVRSGSHITELNEEDHDEDGGVILRKKVTKSDNFDTEDVPSIEELQTIFHESDEEQHDGDLLPTGDFGFGDKFLRFSAAHKETKSIAESQTSKISDDSDQVKKSESIEDIMKDDSILEPSSLLNEIEDILTRSFKHSSLTRSGSSPEKKSSPYMSVPDAYRSERSKSVDNSESTPVRPPRPKKEQRRLRSMSQISYDSCGSDTESLPEIGRNRLGSQSSNISMTLGKARPHPPKPKRHKLLKVQRSQSDVTAMKSIVDKIDTNDKKSPRGRFNPFDKLNDDVEGCDIHKDKGGPNSGNKTDNIRKNRPTRKAPPPPPKKIPLKITPLSPSVDLTKVIPVDERVKSMNLSKQRESVLEVVRVSKRDSNRSSGGPYYHSIKDVEAESSEGDHDYQDITENETRKLSKSRTMSSPPKLPPRNLSNSHSFDTSSLSSAGPELSIPSSVEDVSISSAGFDSPGFKHCSVQNFPKISSPLGKGDRMTHSANLGPSNLSLSSCGGEKGARPISSCSVQSSWSGSQGHSSSSESDGEDEEKAIRKKEKKLFLIAQEVASSERVFVDVLRLLNVDFRKHLSTTTEELGRPVIPNEQLNKILAYLPQLQNFNEELLSDLEERIKHWEEKKCLADIFRKKGPFLKLFSSYILNFESITSALDEALKKYPQFLQAVKEFEMSPRCANLALKHYMLKPIQRIPQYRLLLQDYLKHLPEGSPEIEDMQVALVIVSDVAFHANENMRHEDYVQKMLEIQRSLVGQFEIIKPGRLFLKEGELKKLSRKELQPRYFFLFNDVLLYTTPVATGYRLNNVLPLAGMKVTVSGQDEYKMEFSIISVQRSLILQGATLEEREDWVTALNAAIEENALKRNTFEAVRSQSFEALLDKDFVLGHKAPLWIPDARVTMCMICTCEFTVTFRRHHCRGCGWVVCSNCSDNKIDLRYLKHKIARVCDKCYETLSLEKSKQPGQPSPDKPDGKMKEDDSGTFLNGLFVRFTKIRKSGQKDKKPHKVRPDRLIEFSATDDSAEIKGYLQRWHKGKKWKKQWFLIKDKVLFTFKATEDTAAADSMALLGYEVSRFTESFEGVDPGFLFKLCHANREPIVFRTDSEANADKWFTIMKESASVD